MYKGINDEQAHYLLKWSTVVIDLFTLIPILIARDGVGPPLLDAFGKAIYWTGMVFIPLLILNRDVLYATLSKLVFIFLFSCQCFLVWHFLLRLLTINILFLSVVLCIQFFTFATPFMLERLVQVVDHSSYEEYEVAAKSRITHRDEKDWPIVATSLLLGCPVWTEDQDFFGSGVATWTTSTVEVYLRDA